MNVHRTISVALAGVLGFCLHTSLAAQQPDAALALHTSRVSISGTSNIHEFTAVSTAVRLSRVRITASEGKGVLEAALDPGALTALEIAVPSASLSSPREGLDKNMHKALRAKEFPEITFRLTRLEAGATGEVFRAVGTLSIAGVEREVTLPLAMERGASTLTVRGEIPLVMTEFGITPPKAMLGMLRTDPKVKVAFEVVLQVPQA